jgi:hypothetical protein
MPPAVQTPIRRPMPSAFQWNAGAWFGAQLGSTLWLLLLGVLFLWSGRLSGAWALLAFVFSNGSALLLWLRRDRIGAYPALQLLLAVLGLCNLAAFAGIDLAGDLVAVDPHFADHPRWLYWGLLLYPALALSFYLRERAARRGELH